MERRPSGAIADLMAAACARGRNDDFGAHGANSGKEDEFSDVHGNIIVLFLVAKGTGHTATSGRNGFGGVIFRQRQHAHGGMDGAKGFLVAMALNVDGTGFVGEKLRADFFTPRFTFEEFVEHETVWGEFSCVVLERFFNKGRILVAEAEDSRGFNADERFFDGDDVGEETDVFIGKLSCAANETFGERGASAFGVCGKMNLIAEKFQQFHGRDARGEIIVIGELVAKKVHAALTFSEGCKRSMFFKPPVKGDGIDLGQRAARMEADGAVEHPADERCGKKAVVEPRPKGGETRGAREMRNHPCA